MKGLPNSGGWKTLFKLIENVWQDPSIRSILGSILLNESTLQKTSLGLNASSIHKQTIYYHRPDETIMM